jgi:hypothetical protein
VVHLLTLVSIRLERRKPTGVDACSDKAHKMAFSRANIKRFRSFVKGLETQEVELFAQHDGVCDKCHSPYYGLFDESKSILPLGAGLWHALVRGASGGRIVHPSTGRVIPAHSSFLDDFRPDIDEGHYPHQCYSMRQNIVRSGQWTREQLAGGLFTQHELEINDRSFINVRPRRCDCDFGDEAFLDLDTPVPVLNETQVDLEFQTSPVRTGFRLRSKAARERRRSRPKKTARSSSRPPLVVECYPRVPRNFIVEDPYFFPQRGKVISLKFSQCGVLRKNARRRPPKPRVIVGRTLPPKEKSKYWYFQRTRGKWNYSLHHPLPGDPRPL